MDWLSARQSLDIYPGPIIASHANAAALLPGYDGNRLIPDDVIGGLDRPRRNYRSYSILQVSG